MPGYINIKNLTQYTSPLTGAHTFMVEGDLETYNYTYSNLVSSIQKSINTVSLPLQGPSNFRIKNGQIQIRDSVSGLYYALNVSSGTLGLSGSGQS